MHIDYWHHTREHQLGRLGLGLVLGVSALAFLAPLLTPYAPLEHAGTPLAPPSPVHWLGTNDVGQDIYTQLLYGARTSLVVAAGVTLLATGISLAVGVSTAMLGGLYARFWMRLVDVLLVLPPLVVVILVAAYLEPGLGLLIGLLALLTWPAGARVVRAQTLALQEKMPVTAARTFGAGRRHLFWRHILPDLGPVLVALMLQEARRAVFMEAGLSFLGIADPALVSWGKMMQQALAFAYLEAWQWWLIPPGMALGLTVAGLSLVGYALEEALDPRLAKMTHREKPRPPRLSRFRLIRHASRRAG